MKPDEIDASSSSAQEVKLPIRYNSRVRKGNIKTLGNSSPSVPPTQESSAEDSEGTLPKLTSFSDKSKKTQLLQPIITKVQKPPKLLRLCPNVGSKLARMLEMLDLNGVSGVQPDFGFSFDAAPTIDMVLYFRG